MGCSSQRVQSIRRLQLFVKALCHHWHCPDDPSACPYVNGHLPGETLRQLEHSNIPNSLSVVSVLSVFHLFFTDTHSVTFTHWALGLVDEL